MALYIIATPIGNLEDITYRAVSTLKSVAFILAEDTRETKKLLKKYEIKTQTVSYRDQNHEAMIGKILEKLNIGLDLALVSDSGTPLISDPGFKLVRDLRENSIDIISIPGPSAVISALSISGIPTDKFLFLGFLPKSDTKKKKLLQSFSNIETTVVIYESPNRLIKLLDLFKELYPNQVIAAIRDLTKVREEVFYGKCTDIIEKLLAKGFDNSPHGEWVVIIDTRVS